MTPYRVDDEDLDAILEILSYSRVRLALGQRAADAIKEVIQEVRDLRANADKAESAYIRWIDAQIAKWDLRDKDTSEGVDITAWPVTDAYAQWVAENKAKLDEENES
jgi:hypothetical protein